MSTYIVISYVTILFFVVWLQVASI